jgi:hypothetical protein
MRFTRWAKSTISSLTKKFTKKGFDIKKTNNQECFRAKYVVYEAGCVDEWRRTVQIILNPSSGRPKAKVYRHRKLRFLVPRNTKNINNNGEDSRDGFVFGLLQV